YDETADTTDLERWRKPLSVHDTLQAGRGYFFYVFGDPADAEYNDVLPKTLTMTGRENTPEIDTLSFYVSMSSTAGMADTTDAVEVAERGWNLLGNPFGAAINWDDDDEVNGNWLKKNVDN